MDRYMIGPLDKRHDRKSFRCGVDALDRYIQKQASQDVRRHMGVVYVAEDQTTKAGHGFYTLSMASVALERLPAELARKMPRYPTVPAVRLGRLAVHSEAQGQGLGQHLLMDAIARSLRNEIAWVAFLVDAKDGDARRFYQHFGFQSFKNNDLHLYVMRKTVEQLFR